MDHYRDKKRSKILEESFGESCSLEHSIYFAMFSMVSIFPQYSLQLNLHFHRYSVTLWQDDPTIIDN